MKLRRRPNNNGQLVDRADAQFAKWSLAPGMYPFALTVLDSQPVGTCVVANNPNLNLTPAVLVFQGGLDAGPSLALSGPGGNMVMNKTVTAGQPTDYFVSIGPNYFVPGNYTVTGTGGADIGAFIAALNIPALPTWTNQASVANVNRANGMTITWTGGSAQEYVVIFGGSFTDNTQNTGALFSCLARADAGTFTVPPNVLMTLPAAAASPNGFVQFQPGVYAAVFQAPGLGLGYTDFNAYVQNGVTFR